MRQIIAGDGIGGLIVATIAFIEHQIATDNSKPNRAYSLIILLAAAGVRSALTISSPVTVSVSLVNCLDLFIRLSLHN